MELCVRVRSSARTSPPEQDDSRVHAQGDPPRRRSSAIIFGAATVYLALRAGLTVSASIPIAVLAIAVFKKLGKSTILENNIVQTIGSAGESVAAGVVFTMPALLFLSGGADYFKYVHDLRARGRRRHARRPLHDPAAARAHRQGARQAPVPRGRRLRRRADRRRAGRRPRPAWCSRASARRCSTSSCTGSSGFWRETATWFRTGQDGKIPDATLNCDVTPEYLGLGYIIGPRIAGELVSGGVLSWLGADPADLDLRRRTRASSRT